MVFTVHLRWLAANMISVELVHLVVPYYASISRRTVHRMWNLTMSYFCHLKTQLAIGRARLKCDGTRAETRFGLSAKRTIPFKLAGASVQSTTGSRSVRISGSNGSNAGSTMFRGRVQDNWLPTPLACFPFTSPTARHCVPSGFNWALPHVLTLKKLHFATGMYRFFAWFFEKNKLFSS